MTWHLEHPHADHYTDAEGRRWPRVSTVVAEWQRCAMPSSIPPRVLDEAANLGTVVHAGIATAFGRPMPSALPAISANSMARAMRCAVGFQQFCAELSPVALHVEHMLIDDDLEVIGTADFIGTVKADVGYEGVGVIDWKTSSTVHTGGIVALSQYVQMARQNGIPVEWGAIVRLHKDEIGFEMRPFSLADLRPYVEAFRHLRALHGIAQANNIKEAV